MFKRDFYPMSKNRITEQSKGVFVIKSFGPEKDTASCKTCPKHFQCYFYHMIFFFCSEKLKRSLLRHIFFPLLCIAQVAEISLSNLFSPPFRNRHLRGSEREQICGGAEQRSSAPELLPRSVKQS